MNRESMLWMVVLLSLVVFAGGCKKKDEAKPAQKKAETPKSKSPAGKTPAVKDEGGKVADENPATPDVGTDLAPEAAVDGAATEAPSPVAEPTGDSAGEEPAAVVDAEPSATGQPTSDEAETGGSATEPAAAGAGTEPTPEGDVVTGTDTVAEGDVPDGHFGRKFKLEAIMMISDVIKYPDHYSGFETIKMKGQVLALAGSRVLFGHEGPEGLHVICAELGEHGNQELAPGAVIVLEGALVKEGWSMDFFPEYKPGEKEPGLTPDWILSVQAGEKE